MRWRGPKGHDLASIAQRARLQEGDLVGALQKTLDLISQLRGAAQKGPLGANLVPLLDEADGLLRRGVVQASYTWAVRGLPEVDRGRATTTGTSACCPRTKRRPASGRARRATTSARAAFVKRRAPPAGARRARTGRAIVDGSGLSKTVRAGPQECYKATQEALMNAARDTRSHSRSTTRAVSADTDDPLASDRVRRRHWRT